MDHYIIGNTNIFWHSAGLGLIRDEFMSRFLPQQTAAIPERSFSFREKRMDPDSLAAARCLQHTGGYELLDLDGRLFLMNHWASTRFAYGFWPDTLGQDGDIEIYVNPVIHDGYPLAAVRFISTIGLHSWFLQHHAPVLHGAYIDFRGRGILFCAPSGTGKSTQAALWNCWAGAEIINGDRVLLDRIGGRWHAFGFPCSGSSDICINRTCPLAAIVLLEQGPENRIVPLTLPQKVRALVSATELYPWDSREVQLGFETAQALIRDVPVLKLCCRPDEDAVQTLRGYLEEHAYI